MDDEFSSDQHPNFSWPEFIEQHRWFIFIALIGLSLLGIGLRYLQTPKQADRVQIIPAENVPVDKEKMTIDISGSVNQPGVYDLPFDSRVKDAINIAGGLSASADQQWVQRALNQAQKLKDGQKIYILSVEESSDASFQPPVGEIAGANTSSTISVNSASRSALEDLWGIGPVTAEAIISGRPYSSVQELLDKKIIKQNVWDRNKDKLSL